MAETCNQELGITVVSGGLLTTVQDLGRFQYRRYGMPTAGAADEFSHRVANLLAGNPRDTATLEITITGPELLFRQEVCIALAGAPLGPCLNNREIPMWQSLLVRRGDRLTFSGLRAGCRCYLGVRGGFALPLVMGSQATYMRAKIGGLEGRKLQKGDLLALVYGGVEQIPRDLFRFPASLVPSFPDRQVLRVVPGPQQDYFTGGSLRVFYSSEFQVSSSSDRMGCRLGGPILQHRDKADLISDGMIPGSVQVPGHGNPIVMLSDCATTGGYPKIATVIKADLPRIAQLKPGEKVAFKQVSLKEAHRAYRFFSANFSADRLERVDAISEPDSGWQVYHVSIDGRDYRISLKQD